MFLKSMKGATGALIAVSLLQGCATYQRDAHRGDISQYLNARTGYSLPVYRSDATPFEGRVTMEEAARSALTYNASLAATMEALNLASASEVQAGLLFNPHIESEFIFGGHSTDIDLGLGLNLGQFLTRPARKREARAAREKAVASAAHFVVELVNESRAAVVDLWHKQQRETLAGEIRDVWRAAADVADELARVGNLDDGKLARIKSQLHLSELGYGKAQLARLGAQEKLALVSGRPLGGAVEAYIDDYVPAANGDRATFVAKALEASFLLAQYKAEIARLEATYDIAGLTVWAQELAAEAVLEKEEGTWSEGFALSIPLPIFDIGEARRGAAQARVNAALHAYEGGVLTVRARAATLWQLAAILKEAVAGVSPALDQEATTGFAFDEKLYNAMQIGPLGLLAGRVEFFERQMAMMDLRAEQLHTILTMEALAAGVMTDQKAMSVAGEASSTMTGNMEGDH